MKKKYLIELIAISALLPISIVTTGHLCKRIEKNQVEKQVEKKIIRDNYNQQLFIINLRMGRTY